MSFNVLPRGVASLSMLECVTEHDERHPQEGGLAPLNLGTCCQQK